MYRLYGELKQHGRAHAGTRGDTVEILGVVVRILKPRSRISRS